MFCVKCCETVHMIYQFNNTCLNNVKIYTSRKTVTNKETQEKQLTFTADSTDVEHEETNENILIKTETFYDQCNDDTTNNLNFSYDENLVKKENNDVPNMMDICAVEMTGK